MKKINGKNKIYSLYNKEGTEITYLQIMSLY